MRGKQRGLAARVFVSVIAAGIIALVGGAIWGWSYLNGADFRKLLEYGIGHVFRAETSILPVEWRGLGLIHTEGLIANGYAEASVEKIEFKSVDASFSPGQLTRRILDVRAVNVESAQIVIGSPQRRAPTSAGVENSSAGLLTLIGKVVAPRKFSLGAIHLAKADIKWPGPFGPGSLTGSKITARQLGREWIIDAQGGLLKPSLILPKFAMVQGTIRIEKGQLAVENVELSTRSTEDGEIRVSGKILPIPELALKLKGFDFTSSLHPGVQPILTGAVEGEVKLNGGTATGEIRLSGGRLRGGAPMEKVARLTGRPEYADFRLSKATAAFKSGGDPWQVEVQKLVLESDGLLAVEGFFTTDGGRIDGLFELGLPSDVLRRFPGAASAVFSREDRGYRWTQVRVAGPLNSPENDLVGRLMTAPLNAAFKGIGTVMTRTLETSEKIISEGASQVVETGKAVGEVVTTGAESLIDNAGNLLGGGIKLLGEGAHRTLDVLSIPGRFIKEEQQTDSTP